MAALPSLRVGHTVKEKTGPREYEYTLAVLNPP
jgi:hypothetical protein